jgi:hypothetical protein
MPDLVENPKNVEGFQIGWCKHWQRPENGRATEIKHIMKIFNRISRPLTGGLILAGAIAAIATISRAGGTSPTTKPTPYPLDTCIVSGDKLGGDMGKPIVFIYQTNGINQEIKFCCSDCPPKFKANPDKYMKIILDAEPKAAAKDAKK